MAAYDRAFHQQSWILIITMLFNVGTGSFSLWPMPIQHASEINATVRDWGRNRVVAHMRHLAEQSCLLHRPPAGGI